MTNTTTDSQRADQLHLAFDEEDRAYQVMRNAVPALAGGHVDPDDLIPEQRRAVDAYNAACTLRGALQRDGRWLRYGSLQPDR